MFDDRSHCIDCAYWEHGTRERDGECHKFPPSGAGQGWRQWPVTRASDWCGQFSAAKKGDRENG